MRHRAATADADGVFRDDESRRQLLAFELVCGMLDFIQDPVDTFCVVSGGNNFGRGILLLEVHLQDWVHYLIGRQAVLIKLVRCELRRWLFVDDLVRNNLPPGAFIQVPRDLPNFRF